MFAVDAKVRFSNVGFRKSGHTAGHASERALLFSDQSQSRSQTIVNNNKTIDGACGQNSTRRLVDPRWSHMPIVNCNVAGFSCLQMGHFARYLKWLLFAVMTDSSNFVLKRIGTYDLTGNRLGKGNFAYVELATNRITKTKVCPRIAFWVQSQRQMIVQWLNYNHCCALWVWRMAIIHWFNYSDCVVLLFCIFGFSADLTQLGNNNNKSVF